MGGDYSLINLIQIIKEMNLESKTSVTNKIKKINEAFLLVILRNNYAKVIY